MPELVHAVDQSAMDLCLTLATGAVDYSEFIVLEQDQIITPDFQIEAGIIGASHFFVLDLGDEQLHEVFACTEVRTGNFRSRFGPLKHGLGKVDLEFFGGVVHYSFCPKLTDWEKGFSDLDRIERMAKMAAGNPNQLGLIYEFPSNGREQSKTVVFLRWLEAKNQVFVNTVHSYPNEQQIAFTTSQIDVKGGNP